MQQMATSSAVQGIKTEAQKMWCCIFRGGNDSFSSLFKMNLIFWVLEKMFLFFYWKSFKTSNESRRLDFQNSILKLEEMRSYLVNAFCL